MRDLFIGKLAKQVGLNPRTIRYYERLGVLPAPRRSETGYRLYTPETAELLHFIQKAKTLGFTLVEIREIIALRREGQLPCLHVHALLLNRVERLSRQIESLSLLRDELRRLAKKSASHPRRRPSPIAVCPHIERARIAPLPLPSRRKKNS
jgi:DNA-binding transcriptional MerR regulator